MKSTPNGYYQSVYLPDWMWEEVVREAKRLDRPKRRVIQLAWRIARKRILAFTSEDEFLKGLE